MRKIYIAGLCGYSYFYRVNNFPDVGETLTAKEFNFEIGGKGYNQAIACHKFMSDVVFASSINKNDTQITESLDKLGIKHHMAYKDCPSASAAIIRNDAGDNKVIEYLGASKKFQKNDIKDTDIESCDTVLLQYEISEDVIEHIISIAKKYHKTIILNPAPFIYRNISILNKADIITPNRIETCQILGIDISSDLETIKGKILLTTLPTMVITLGENGVLLYHTGTFKMYPALKVKTVDTTGAGDIFNAALASRYNGSNLDESIKFAVLASGLSVTKNCVVNSIPELQEIERMLKNEK